MKLKLILASLLVFLSNSTAQEVKPSKYIESTHLFLKTLDDVARFQFYNFNINLKDKTITYPTSKGILYFDSRKEYNREIIYFINYTFNFDLQTSLNKLSRKF